MSGKIKFKTSNGIIEISLSAEEIKFLDLLEFWQDDLGVICNYFEDSQRVSDVVRYKVVIKGNYYCIENFIDNPIDGIKKQVSGEFIDYSPEDLIINKNILLILESPHDHEYEEVDAPQSLRPIGPAINSAGRNLQSSLSKVVESLKLDDGIYNLIISNPVPYQTSLFALHSTTVLNKDLRDKVWMNLFSNNAIFNEFVQRINSYDANAIINCCTGKLKQCVELILRINCDKNVLFNAIHPSAPSFIIDPGVKKLG